MLQIVPKLPVYSLFFISSLLRSALFRCHFETDALTLRELCEVSKLDCYHFNWRVHFSKMNGYIRCSSVFLLRAAFTQACKSCQSTKPSFLHYSQLGKIRPEFQHNKSIDREHALDLLKLRTSKYRNEFENYLFFNKTDRPGMELFNKC